MSEALVKQAESLWFKAHESIRAGNLPQAARELAESFEILKELQDPRLRQVHEKWVDVYRILESDTKSISAPQQQATQEFSTLQAQAEEAANRGDLTDAIRIYQAIVTQDDTNELALERFHELNAALVKARDYNDNVASEGSLHTAARQPSEPEHVQPDAANQIGRQDDPSLTSTPHAPEEEPPKSAQTYRLEDEKIAFLEDLLQQIRQRKRAVSSPK